MNQLTGISRGSVGVALMIDAVCFGNGIQSDKLQLTVTPGAAKRS